MEEIGIVKSVNGRTARVLMSRRNSCCESCEKESCDMPEGGVETEAINAAGARVGQKVKVVMKSFTYIKGALIIYVLPIAALIGGAILGKMYLPDMLGWADSDLSAALTGFIAFFASLVIVKVLSSRMDKKLEYQSVIESIMEG